MVVHGGLNYKNAVLNDVWLFDFGKDLHFGGNLIFGSASKVEPGEPEEPGTGFGLSQFMLSLLPAEDQTGGLQRA